MTRKHKGQGLVEFSLLLPIALLMILGAVDVAPVWPLMTVNQEAAQYGAHAAAAWTPQDGITCYEAVRAAVISRAEYLMGFGVSAVCSGMTPITRGTSITVTVVASYQPPFYGTFLNPPVPRTFSITRRSTIQDW